MLAQAGWQLLALLADGGTHHVAALAERLAIRVPQLNQLWQQMPAHIRGLLRQQDGYWRLVRSLAVWERSWLKEEGAHAGWRVELLDEHASSNQYLMALAKESPEAAHRRLVLVHHQTAGRGRQGRQWASRVGECVMLSAGWQFSLPQSALGALAPVLAIACCRALAEVGVAVQIKWPNDLVVGGQKLGGILIETIHVDGITTAIMGVGINFVSPKAVPDACAVQNFASGASAQDLLATLMRAWAQVLSQFAREGFAPFLAEYHRLHRDQNQPVRLLQQGETWFEGEALGVDETGGLFIRSADGNVRQVVSGEISLRPLHEAGKPHANAAEKLLLLDAGNSKLKWAWLEEGRIGFIGRAAYQQLEELAAQAAAAGAYRAVGSAVCGEMKKELVAQALGFTPEWLGSMPQAIGIRNHYRYVNEHGADRWFNVLGARSFTQEACVVVSCGTAVTIDALTADNHYLGGSILPGFNLMQEAMALNTAQLNRKPGRAYPFATTTPNALASGMNDAICGAVMLMHHRLQQRHEGGKVDILITGGGALKVKQGLPEDFALDNRIEIVDNLVIHGLSNWIEQE